MILTSSYPRYAGDYAGIFVASLASALQRTNFKVVVVAPHGPSLAAHETTDGVAIIRYRYAWPSTMERLAYGGGILPNLMSSWAARLALLPYVVATLFACLRYGRNQTVIHAHWLHNGTLAVLCKYFIHRPVVVTVHGPDLSTLSRFRVGRWMIRWTCRRAAGVIAVSESIRQKIIVLGIDADKVRHIPNGVPDEDEFLAIPLNQRADGHRLLYVGRLVPQKTVGNLLISLRTVLKEEPATTLTIVGEGPLRVELEAMTKQLGLEKIVNFVGAQSRRRIPGWFRQADIFVLPSRVEGFPIVILEAMAAGRAIVATATEGVPEIIQDGQNGRLVPTDDPAALADAILSLLRYPHERQRFAVAARSTISKRYRWSTIASTTAQYYVECATAR
ncbi:MAG: glycosyltransferase family 4 protein [Patescibacteria group bacterium]